MQSSVIGYQVIKLKAALRGFPQRRGRWLLLPLYGERLEQQVDLQLCCNVALRKISVSYTDSSMSRVPRSETGFSLVERKVGGSCYYKELTFSDVIIRLNVFIIVSRQSLPF